MEIVSNVLLIGEFLGEGYFSDVYRATHQVHGNVAVKVLKVIEGEKTSRKDGDPLIRTQVHPDPTVNELKMEEYRTKCRAILEEGRNLKAGEHQNVVQVLDVVFDKSGALLLIVELCQDSVGRLYEHGPIPCRKVRDIGNDVALGLQSLHLRGMIHRDIKPGNILIDHNGRAKLSDFGLVVDYQDFGYASRAGYAEHLAPECWNRGVTSKKTDVWALGVTLYRMLHGSEWYDNVMGRISIEDVKNGGFAKKLKWLPHISPEWRRVIRKMLHDDTSQRYAETNQVLNALSGLPISPDWVCDYSTTGILWKALYKKRMVVIELLISPGGKYSWTAKSLPHNKPGRARLLDSSSEASKAKAFKDLECYFKKFR